ncbi:MAG: hypothetical protein JWQ35_1814, partial [Bacteriovoracaceae bacterium]|nr:hypothetical protein [Bacteriovoracaceae bacterium]
MQILTITKRSQFFLNLVKSFLFCTSMLISFSLTAQTNNFQNEKLFSHSLNSYERAALFFIRDSLEKNTVSGKDIERLQQIRIDLNSSQAIISLKEKRLPKLTVDLINRRNELLKAALAKILSDLKVKGHELKMNLLKKSEAENLADYVNTLTHAEDFIRNQNQEFIEKNADYLRAEKNVEEVGNLYAHPTTWQWISGSDSTRLKNLEFAQKQKEEAQSKRDAVLKKNLDLFNANAKAKREKISHLDKAIEEAGLAHRSAASTAFKLSAQIAEIEANITFLEKQIPTVQTDLAGAEKKAQDLENSYDILSESLKRIREQIAAQGPFVRSDRNLVTIERSDDEGGTSGAESETFLLKERDTNSLQEKSELSFTFAKDSKTGNLTVTTTDEANATYFLRRAMFRLTDQASNVSWVSLEWAFRDYAEFLQRISRSILDSKKLSDLKDGNKILAFNDRWGPMPLSEDVRAALAKMTVAYLRSDETQSTEPLYSESEIYSKFGADLIPAVEKSVFDREIKNKIILERVSLPSFEDTMSDTLITKTLEITGRTEESKTNPEEGSSADAPFGFWGAVNKQDILEARVSYLKTEKQMSLDQITSH